MSHVSLISIFEVIQNYQITWQHLIDQHSPLVDYVEPIAASPLFRHFVVFEEERHGQEMARQAITFIAIAFTPERALTLVKDWGPLSTSRVAFAVQAAINNGAMCTPIIPLVQEAIWYMLSTWQNQLPAHQYVYSIPTFPGFQIPDLDHLSKYIDHNPTPTIH